MACGIPCAKKILDNCGALGAEALALEVENFGSNFLAAEARALYTALEAVTEAAGDLELYIEPGPKTETAEAHSRIQKVLDESYKSCDYAKELRKVRDNIRSGHISTTIGVATDALAGQCREIRDEILAVFTGIATKMLVDEGYKVPQS